jgi:hypothetical protein
MTTLLQDLRFALRPLRKSPGFTIVAVLTLALGIDANAVVLSVMNGLILRPLNVPQAQSLYGIERASDKDMSQSSPDYLDLRDRNRSFDDLAAFSITQVALDTGENPSLIWGVEASGNHFDAWRIQPYRGRFFHASDAHGASSARYIVFSYAYWHSHFHDDRGMLKWISSAPTFWCGSSSITCSTSSVTPRSRAQEMRLHRVDERLFQAKCLGRALKGIGWGGAVRHNSAVPNILRELRAL